MESITRYVDKIESDERRMYESVLGHALRDNQQVVLRVIESARETDEANRRAALGKAVEIARQGRIAVEAQGIPADQADDAINETIEKIRRSKH
jgi:hypothetical protein